MTYIRMGEVRASAVAAVEQEQHWRVGIPEEVADGAPRHPGGEDAEDVGVWGGRVVALKNQLAAYQRTVAVIVHDQEAAGVAFVAAHEPPYGRMRLGHGAVERDPERANAVAERREHAVQPGRLILKAREVVVVPG